MVGSPIQGSLVSSRSPLVNLGKGKMVFSQVCKQRIVVAPLGSMVVNHISRQSDEQRECYSHYLRNSIMGVKRKYRKGKNRCVRCGWKINI
jgi:hypothetical protein